MSRTPFIPIFGAIILMPFDCCNSAFSARCSPLQVQDGYGDLTQATLRYVTCRCSEYTGASSRVEVRNVQKTLRFKKPVGINAAADTEHMSHTRLKDAAVCRFDVSFGHFLE
jgi:hypothetical protein